jgi:hypothetical protein
MAADLTIRLGEPAPSDELVCRRLGQFERWLVASPAYGTRPRAGRSTATEHTRLPALSLWPVGPALAFAAR